MLFANVNLVRGSQLWQSFDSPVFFLLQKTLEFSLGVEIFIFGFVHLLLDVLPRLFNLLAYFVAVFDFTVVVKVTQKFSPGNELLVVD
jgi:hypothetical protein